MGKSAIYLFINQTCNLGATFDRDKKMNSAILEYAVQMANKNILRDSDIELGSAVELLEYGNEFEAAERVCRLLEVKSIFFYNF